MKNQVNFLTNDLAKFLEGKDTLDKLLGNQHFGSEKVGLGFVEKPKAIFPKNDFTYEFLLWCFRNEANRMSKNKRKEKRK